MFGHHIKYEIYHRASKADVSRRAGQLADFAHHATIDWQYMASDVAGTIGA